MKNINVIFMVMLVVFLSACSGLGGAGRGYNPEAAELNVQLGLSYLQKERPDLAKIKFDRAIKQASNSSRANWGYALLEEKLGNMKSAAKYFDKATKLDPDDSEGHNNYGAFLCRQDRVKEALAQFKMAVANRLYETPEYAYLNAGMCAAGHNDTEQAEGFFRQALDEKDNYVSALYQMALLTYQQKRYLASRAFRQRAEDDLSDNDPKLLWLCVMTERELKNSSEANECGQALKADFPTSSEAATL
ncbi:MAG: type IV pilus biogenesis/stability protein PilW [Thiothrix sp.]|nr:MAG: type IV pilus biogenesis/stability protein PilW [Thiothrix sp.]